MRMSGRAVALCWAVLLAAGAASAYTVDCNHEYTDCDTELSKLSDDEELPSLKTSPPLNAETTPTPLTQPTTTTLKTTDGTTEISTEAATERTEAPEEVKPHPRLLNLNVDELQNFANALHNQTDSTNKKLTDLSDVTLDDEDEELPRTNENQHRNKDISDKFYSNLQAPFHALMSGKSESSEIETCKENEIAYKIGDKIDRGCEESCECTPGGIFECSPRCKHPYIRRGRRLNDPLCFESPVDACCSIIACATGNGDAKITKLELCKYNNETYPLGSQWYIGCESTCTCEANSVVTCKPRCKPLSPSEKCINVQDPADACCEVQVCDVSQDAHEISENVTSTTTKAPHTVIHEDDEERVSISRPLVLAEPIGSIKVLQNNSVQVNLMQPNNSRDPIHLLLSEDGGKNFQAVELKHSNLILNLEGGKNYVLKTRETGTKFNFTITATDSGATEANANVSMAGCWEDGKFYEVGEEFKIGCTELCECTGPDTHECVALVCPNHVGLEIMSKGCVKWAPSPPAQPPNCCPRSARCLSDGTCHFNGVPVPNWSEVPISLTGCEQRCFCENGDLDCQEVCSPLPPVPPQTMRCPPMHRPAAVNISDEDCCKQWGCVPIEGRNGSQLHSMPVFSEATNYVTPIPPISPSDSAQVLPEPPVATDSIISHYRYQNPFKSHLKLIKTATMPTFINDMHDGREKGNNTISSVSDTGPDDITETEGPIITGNDYWSHLLVPTDLIPYTKAHTTNKPGILNDHTTRGMTDLSIDDIVTLSKTVQTERTIVTGNDYWPYNFNHKEQEKSDSYQNTHTTKTLLSSKEYIEGYQTGDNITIFSDSETNSFKAIQEESPMVTNSDYRSLHYPYFSKPKIHANSKSNPSIYINKKPIPSSVDTETYHQDGNITVFAVGDISSPFKTIQPEPPIVTAKDFWQNHPVPKNQEDSDSITKTHLTMSQIAHSHPSRRVNFVMSGDKVRDILNPSIPYQFPNYREHNTQIFNSQEVERSKKPLITSSESDTNYFAPTHHKNSPLLPFNSNYRYKNEKDMPASSNYQPNTLVTPNNKYFFEPIINNRTDYILTKTALSNSFPNVTPIELTLDIPSGKHVSILNTKVVKGSKQSDGYDTFWAQNEKSQVLTKQQNPYETILLRAVQSPKPVKTAMSNQNLHNSQVTSKPYSAMDLEHLLNQMEVQSEVNRNLGRSADKNQGPTAGHNPQMPPEFPSHKPQSPPFLPTIPPEPHYPHEDDYDQNNIHHSQPSEQPVLPGLPAELPGLPPGLQVPSSFGDMNKKLSVISIESDSPTSIKMLLGLPPVLVGLRGSVDLRYTDKADEDVSHWYSQVFAPADEVLTTPRLEFRLTGLKPGTMYKVRGKLYLHNLPVSPESFTYSVRTHELPTVGPVEEKRREIDSSLTVVDVNDTTAHVSWKHFNEEELQLIDGIQVRYRPVGTPIYSMTELLHHSRSAAELHDLRPGSRYEASLVLIPPPRATTELHDPGSIEFTTAPYNDPYNWTVVIEVRSVGAEAAELTWHGVPSPAERWVRVYRAAHACGDLAAGKEQDEFRLAARDQPPSVTLSGLVPDTRCRVWLELFLTNGKVKTSNVLEINTKSLDTDNPIDNEIEASGQSGSARGRPRGDYYTALVGVGVVAALGALTSLLLLLVVVRRHRPRSVPITPVPTAPRESSLPPYDNPAYKLELQQETMDL